MRSERKENKTKKEYTAEKVKIEINWLNDIECIAMTKREV